MEKYVPDRHATCPYCGRDVRFLYAKIRHLDYGNDLPTGEGCRIGDDPALRIYCATCPACKQTIVQAENKGKLWLVAPRHGMRRPLHSEVPPEISTDYHEAVLVLTDSPKSSAALSRRCLQSLLVLQGAKKSDLCDQLLELLPLLPGYVQPYVDHVRKLGNISAHAKRSKTTGEIVEVEHGEAEWMLELLEELFDHFYTKPAESKAKQAALNAKFADAGKFAPKSP